MYKIVLTHMRRYPQMTIQDLYKLSHQAALGNTHLGQDPAKILRGLQEEIAFLSASKHEPFIEDVSPDGRVVRVHLRVFKALQGNLERLCRAMLQSAKTFPHSTENLESYWRMLEEMAEEGLIPYKTRALQMFIELMRTRGYPAVHHSASYRQHYQPAYRVILRQYVQTALKAED